MVEPARFSLQGAETAASLTSIFPAASASSSLVGPIRCIIYCEFDNIDGPRIFHQHPPHFLGAERFDAISKFIITDEKLQESPLTITAFGYTFVGYPVGIPGQQYARSNLLFNICFVFDEDSPAVTAHMPVVCKLGQFMRALEVESSFLVSQGEGRDDVGAMLPRLMHDLNVHSRYECHVTETDMLCLQVFRQQQLQHLQQLQPTFSPQNFASTSDDSFVRGIQSHKVPVLIRLLEPSVRRRLDATTLHLLPFIDGIRHIHRISLEANCAIDLTKKVVRQLIAYDCVRLIDIFQYSNLYAVTSRVSELAFNSKLQWQCLQYISATAKLHGDKDQSARLNRELFARVLRMYMALDGNITVDELLLDPSRHGIAATIDVRRFIAFGLFTGVLRRVHRFPCLTHTSRDIANLRTLAGRIEAFMTHSPTGTAANSPTSATANGVATRTPPSTAAAGDEKGTPANARHAKVADAVADSRASARISPKVTPTKPEHRGRTLSDMSMGVMYDDTPNSSTKLPTRTSSADGALSTAVENVADARASSGQGTTLPAGKPSDTSTSNGSRNVSASTSANSRTTSAVSDSASGSRQASTSKQPTISVENKLTELSDAELLLCLGGTLCDDELCCLLRMNWAQVCRRIDETVAHCNAQKVELLQQRAQNPPMPTQDRNATEDDDEQAWAEAFICVSLVVH